jgi:hypothetical protein
MQIREVGPFEGPDETRFGIKRKFRLMGIPDKYTGQDIPF